MRSVSNHHRLPKSMLLSIQKNNIYIKEKSKINLLKTLSKFIAFNLTGTFSYLNY